MTEVMTCGRARRIRFSSGPRAPSEAGIAAEQHHLSCNECAHFEHDMRTLRETVRRLPPTVAPADVRNRVFAAVARARAGEPARRYRRFTVGWFIAATAAALVLAAALTVYRLTPAVAVGAISALSEDHARAAGTARLQSSDRAAVSQWISGQVHFAMYVPELIGARLRGARVRLVGGRRGAVIEYDVQGIALSYFVTPDGTALGGHRQSAFEHHMHDGYRVVIWREAGLEHAMVANLPDAHLVRFARSCIDQAKARVALRMRPTFV